MTPEELPTGAPAPDEPRPGGSAGDPAGRARRRRLALYGLALVLFGAIGSFAISAWTTTPVAPGETAPTTDDDAPGRLAAHEAPPKPVPAGAVDVLVVERGTDTPVAGITVFLRHELAGDEDAPFAATDADGRARLTGAFPAFVELESDTWTSAPQRVPADEKTTVRLEVVPRTPFLVRLADERTGLAVPGWTIGCVDGDGTATATADEQGVAALPRRRRPPEVVAATDGKRRVHLFLLAAFPGRDDARLELPPAERATTVRAIDETGAAIRDAVVAIGSASTGVAIPCDERGEATLEYGARTAVPVVVSAPGRAPRALRLDGAPTMSVVLLPTSARRFRLRTADGTRVPDGVRVRVVSRGPTAYGFEGAGRTFGATVADDEAVVPGLPTGAFEALVLVDGAGLSTLARVRAGEEPSAPIDVVVGPGRRFLIGTIVGEPDGPSPTAIVRVDGRTACGADVHDAARDLVETFAEGRAVDALGSCIVVRGPEAEIVLPRSTEPRRVEVLTARGEFACLVIGPEEQGGTKSLAFADARPAAEPTPTTLRIEWAEGGTAETLSLEIRMDERGAPTVEAFTDSSGTAVVRLAPGRYVVEAVTGDGARFVGDGPLLVPSAGPVPLRMRPLPR